jgi:hypothetical protein
MNYGFPPRQGFPPLMPRGPLPFGMDFDVNPEQEYVNSQPWPGTFVEEMENPIIPIPENERMFSAQPDKNEDLGKKFFEVETLELYLKLLRSPKR